MYLVQIKNMPDIRYSGGPKNKKMQPNYRPKTKLSFTLMTSELCSNARRSTVSVLDMCWQDK